MTKIYKGMFDSPVFNSAGIEIMSQDPPGLSVKERDEFHLKCRGKGEATMDLKWKWVPALEPLYKEEPVEEKYFKQLIPGKKSSHTMLLERRLDRLFLLGIPTVEENEESFADLGRFHTSSLLWTRIPRNASGFYICYDRSNKNLPVSSVKLTVVSSGNYISVVFFIYVMDMSNVASC